MTALLSNLPLSTAARSPERIALRHRESVVTYAALAGAIEAAAAGSLRSASAGRIGSRST